MTKKEYIVREAASVAELAAVSAGQYRDRNDLLREYVRGLLEAFAERMVNETERVPNYGYPWTIDADRAANGPENEDYVISNTRGDICAVVPASPGDDPEALETARHICRTAGHNPYI